MPYDYYAEASARRRRQKRQENLMFSTFVAVLLAIVVVLVTLYVRHVDSDCAAMGGHVKWLYGGKNGATNYLCLSQDGRILG